MKVFTTVKETVPKNHRELLIKIGSSLHQSLDFPQHSIENENPLYFCVVSFKANPGGGRVHLTIIVQIGVQVNIIILAGGDFGASDDCIIWEGGGQLLC